MRYSPFLLIQLVAMGIALASCGGPTDSSGDTAGESIDATDNTASDDEPQEDEAPEDEAELMRQAAIDAGIPVSDVVVPEISARTYTVGNIQINVSGFFEINASPALDTMASISDGGYTWIQYGTSGGAAPQATLTIGNGDIGITVAVGSYIATGTSTECTITTDVTPTRVSGHYSCPKVTGYSQSDRSIGDVTIEIDFEANS